MAKKKLTPEEIKKIPWQAIKPFNYTLLILAGALFIGVGLFYFFLTPNDNGFLVMIDVLIGFYAIRYGLKLRRIGKSLTEKEKQQVDEYYRNN